MVIVTGGASADFAKLTDLINSVNKWEPKRKIVVFDLGLQSSQADELAEMTVLHFIHSSFLLFYYQFFGFINVIIIKNVEVEKFDFASHPVHVQYVINNINN